ncbi:MAG: NAD(P)H-dependent oxidoreductase [Defluviitaleaceae bacterium]|nr:NAD(P)H-dependent oxidoreductase [Defluviitaleaceae bacterium]
MKVLVINGHPDDESYVSALFRGYVENLNKDRHEVRVLELGKMSFDPVLRHGYRKRMEEDQEILQSQEYVQWAEHIVLFYPIWFETVPSLLQGWFERVLSPGVAYKMDGYKIAKMLKGKTAHLVSTSLSPVLLQILRGDIELRAVKRVLKFCGIKIRRVDRLGHYVVGKYENPGKRKSFLSRLERQARLL